MKHMPVNYEVKGHLARLLATENLIVENKKVSTACFDVERRVLTLPMWDRASSFVYDLLVAHEVGHALYTPNEVSSWDKIGIPKDYVNVTEDARVEKLMKRRYAGLAKTFYRGYSKFHEDDFFNLEGTDVSKMSLADRINLHFKIGNFVKVPFAKEEMFLVDLVANEETFEDAIEAARLIYEFTKNNKQQKVDKSEDGSESGGNSTVNSDTDNSGGSTQSTQGESSDGDGDDERSESGSSSSGGGSSASREAGDTESSTEVLTNDIFDEKSKELNSEMRDGNVYIELPKLTLEQLCYSNEDTCKLIKDHFAMFTEDEFKYADQALNAFLDSSKKEVNYLVKEFECKKSADAYARSSVSKTGVLDTSKLHTYKYNDDIFRKVTVVPDGKNHGLVFVLDWSGSMGNILMDTVKQLINLISFCKKVNIPFDVYLFTNSWYSLFDGSNEYSPKNEYLQEFYSEGELFIESCFKMVNIVTSSAKNRDIDVSIKNLWRIAYSHSFYTDYSIPPNFSLSGTPLNEAIISLHKIIPEFTSKNKLQKVNVVILTDGEAANSYMTVKSDYHWGKNGERLGINSCSHNTFLRNRKTGEIHRLGNWFVQTNAFLADLGTTFPQVNLIGIRLLANREWSRFCASWVAESDRKKVDKEWKQNNSASIPQEGFDAFLAISCNTLNNDVEFEVSECATKSQIRNAFKKSLNSKALNKKILSEFIQLVA